MKCGCFGFRVRVFCEKQLLNKLSEFPDALPVVSQGITTIIAGQDGASPFPLDDFKTRLATNPAAVPAEVMQLARLTAQQGPNHLW
jgi:hypothetical protein